MTGQDATAGRAARTRDDRMDANGTAWRMRSLVAMGHDATRIARTLNVTPDTIRYLIRGSTKTITVTFHQFACQLWDVWWDKTPPQRSPAERRAATMARHQAEQHDWPAAAGLDEDLLDNRGYHPWCHYHPATGTGIAPDFHPDEATQPKTRRIA